MGRLNFEKSIFIVGCCNSGTSILFNGLRNGHPKLGGFTRELHNHNISPTQKDEGNVRLSALYPSFKRMYADSTERKPEQVGFIGKEETLAGLGAGRTPDTFVDGERLVFKGPRLILKIKWIREVFPSSYIIHLVRDPFACVEEMRRRTKMGGDIPSFTSQWLVTNALADLDSRFLGRVVRVRYEDMIDHPEAFFKELFKFLELDPEGFKQTIDFKQDQNQSSRNRLSDWELDLIGYMTNEARGRYGYE